MKRFWPLLKGPVQIMNFGGTVRVDRSTLDYILVPSHSRASFGAMSIIEDADLGSDHRPVSVSAFVSVVPRIASTWQLRNITSLEASKKISLRWFNYTIYSSSPADFVFLGIFGSLVSRMRLMFAMS
jgi:hypothetical protein